MDEITEQSTAEISIEVIQFLSDLFASVLGKATDGNVAFCRCLAPDVVKSLGASSSFAPLGWEVRAVLDRIDQNKRWITSDHAVEVREDKGPAILLLVDVGLAGAGMDGIYSASREITEDMLYKQAKALAKRRIGKELFELAETAIKQVRYIGERKSLSKWQQLEFFSSISGEQSRFGSSIAIIGLWPIQGTPESINEKALQISARMVDRLFMGSGNARTPAERVQSLLLEGASHEQVIGLQRLIRESARKPLVEVLEDIIGQPQLWINEIQPGFLSQQLQRVKLRDWRDRKGSISKWSGLTDGNPPQFLLSSERVAKLEVRFETEPEQLPKGSVEYRISVISGEDELAYRHVSHVVKKGAQYQTVKLTAEDFENVLEDSQFEAKVIVSVVGMDTEIFDESEEFLIRFGDAPIETTSNLSRFERCMVEGALHISDVEQFEIDVANPHCFEVSSTRNHVAFRAPFAKKSYKVQRPSLIDVLERMQSEQVEIGRWSVRVREDGQRVEDPKFHRAIVGDANAQELEKAQKNFFSLKKDLKDRGGFWGGIYSTNLKSRVDTTINSWIPILEQGHPELALAETLEVQSLSGKTIGLIVLPSHPLRIAWHSSYDNLLRFLRYDLGLSPIRTKEAVGNLHASHFPSILPGLEPGQNFVYADTLAFFANAMVSDQDKEPKSSVAMLMRALGLQEHDPSVSSMGFQVSVSLAREISRYIQFHGLADSSAGAVLLHALRPGDGCTVARAIGNALKSTLSGEEGEVSPIRFNLEMFPAQPGSDITGNFLVDLVERHRTGAAGIADADRWMLESHSLASGVTLPRLRWARKDSSLPCTPSHIAVAFDSFNTRVSYVPIDRLPKSAPLHIYGLIANIQRSFEFKPTPNWNSWVPIDSDGEKHPVARVLSDRLLKLNKALMKCVCRRASKSEDYWPVLQTTLAADQQDSLRLVHALSDWVITVDRNAGIEYFDAPRDEPSIYETYVIDCVPERDDLGSLQMITSTTRTDEIRELLDQMLVKMSLSASRRNCEFLVRHLKALSGRLAMRLTSLGSTSSELIALALVHSQCENTSEEDSASWMSLHRGFFIPVDDIPDLAPKVKRVDDDENSASAARVRSDLIFVSIKSRGSFSLTFVEVKYRRNLRAARAPDLAQQIAEQTEGHRDAWMKWYFDEKVAEPVLAVRRSKFARAMRFYLEKARRHYLSEEFYERLLVQIDRWMIDGVKYKLAEPNTPTRGYVFCPEYINSDPTTISHLAENTKIVLFGATTMPDLAVGVERAFLQATEFEASVSTTSSEPVSEVEISTSSSDPTDADGLGPLNSRAELSENANRTNLGSGKPSEPAPQSAAIRFGQSKPGDEPVNWNLSSSANPHLMIVGFPGMGKTEAVMNICQQLHSKNIVPIIFSYHADIDERLSTRLKQVRLLNHSQLGFNPMHIETVTPTAHVDSAGMLRDIFAAMFTDLGDIQLERLRTAIRNSYVRHGWGTSSDQVPTIPDFRDFYTQLKSEPKPEKNLLARLDELDDYHVFENSGDVRSLLETEIPMVLQIHATQNEMVQRATAMIGLFNIYKEMFRRGVQTRITHAVIFDEAHRASKMKLLPKLAAECRKFGISLILASQSAKDFDTALFSNVASYLLLRMTDQDAAVLAKNITTSDQSKRTCDRLKQLEKYNALFFREGHRQATHVLLDGPT